MAWSGNNFRVFLGMLDPEVLIEGILFRARYLGTTQLVCEGRPTKSLRMMQAEEAVSRIKVRVVADKTSLAHFSKLGVSS